MDILSVCFVRISLAGIILFVVINIFQLPYYTNVIANGTKIEKDALKIVNYWEEHKDSYENIYFVKTEQDSYEGNIYAYFPVKVFKISEKELDGTKRNIFGHISKKL